MNAFTCHLPATKVISNQKTNRIFAWAWLNSETWKLRFSVSSYCITIKPVIHRFPCFVPDLSFWPATSSEMTSKYIFLVLSSILSSCPSYSSQAENFLPLSLCQYILSCLEVPFLHLQLWNPLHTWHPHPTLHLSLRSLMIPPVGHVFPSFLSKWGWYHILHHA